MIAAICFKINDGYKAKLYLAGTYSHINWDDKQESVLGERFFIYDFKEAGAQKAGIFIDQGLDEEYILRIVETKRYMLKIECAEGELMELPHFYNEENKFLKCEKDKDSISFQFINYLGRSRLLFKYGDLTETLRFEVVPDKMNYEDDYIVLTEAVAQICSTLLLECSGATSNIYSQSEDNQKTLLEQFIFLRQFCYSQNLQGLFEAVKRNPDRALVLEETYKPLGCGRPSRKFYMNPFFYGKGWEKIGNNQTGVSVYVPQKVAITRKHDSLDTPANRFVKFAFQKFDAVCTALINILERGTHTRQVECLKEAEAIHKALEKIFQESFFDEVGTLDMIPQNNQVLQKREGYSQIFSAYIMLDLALGLDWRGKDNVYEGESKNVALLYEYWLFFELYKIIKSIDGCERVNIGENPFVTVTDGITISLEEGRKSCQGFEIHRLGIKINLYYNRTFLPVEFQTTKYEGSYSRPFRPDYTLAIYPSLFAGGRYNGEEDAIKSGAVSYIHFDAKYRISDLAALIGKSGNLLEDEEEIAEDKIGSVVNTYKRGDLLKMHTYNDAIRRTIGSYVLYPGSDNTMSQKKHTFSLYDEILPGVGAFAIKPSICTQGENELKKFIITLITSKKDNCSRLNRMKYYSEMVLKEPPMRSQRNINARSVSDERSGDTNMTPRELCVLGYIRADAQEDYYFFLRDNNLLRKGAEFLFYFYAIKGNDVYSHHKDIFRAADFRFYTNSINESNTYKLEPVLCKIKSNELVSRSELIERLRARGYTTDEAKHRADFYFVLSVKVAEELSDCDEIKISEINAENGNDTFSPHSPKVIYY